MVRFNILYIFYVYMYWSITVLEIHSKIPYRRQCPTIQLNNGRVKLRSGGRLARISCNRLFKLVQGSETMTCVRGQWDTEFPICAKTGCSTVLDNIPHGKLIVVDEARLEIECDLGFVIDGPSFTYCNEFNEWNDELKGCKGNDRIYTSCDFESSDGRFCGWQNDRFNHVDWLADKTSFAFYLNTHHVTPGSSQYFTSNYISLDAGNYGSSTFGKLISPQIPPVESKQRCLIFSYKLISGTSYGEHTLTVTYGNIPHWTTSGGEGRVIIGLYKFNITSQIIIEGKNCKAAIDNIIVTEGHSCSQKPYEDELDTCHDNCGKISYDDNSCSCDWECHLNDNCCSDINRKCPFIQPLEDIKRLYLTTASPIAVKTTPVFKYTDLDPTTSTLSTISPKIINESIISNNSVRVSTPMNEHNVTVDKITNTFTQHTTTPHFTYNTSTEKPKDILKLNSTITFNSSSFFHITTNSKTTAMTYLDVITNINTTPKIMNIPNTTDNILVKNITSVDTISADNFNSTIKPSVMNMTYTQRVSNTSNMTTKSSLLENNFSNINLVNTINSTLTFFNKPPSINTTFSMKIINSTINITINPNSVNLSTLSPEGKKAINTFKLTFQPLTTRTSSIIDATNITTESSSENATNSTKLINLSSTMKILPSTRKFNELNSFELLNTTIIKNPSKVLNITPNDVITESMITINNSLTHVSNINNYTVPNEDITFDINQSNLNLSRFIYETNTKLYIIPNETTTSSILHSDNTSTEHMKKNGYSPIFFVSYVVIIIKYLAAIGVILITVKFSFSFIRWYVKKPIEDDMNSCFIKTDNESSCNMELKTHHM